MDSTADDGSTALGSTTVNGCACVSDDDATCGVEQPPANTNNVGIKTAEQAFLAN